MNQVAANTAQDESLATVVDELFGTGNTTLTLRDGTVVTFRQAKFKQIAEVTRLFQRLLDSVPRDRFLDLLNAIAEAQLSAMNADRSANDISLNTASLLEKAFGQNSMLLSLFATVMDILPEFIPQFSDMDAVAFAELDIEEAVLVASGVVASNYSFFTQKLLPLLKSVMHAWSNKRAGETSTQK